MDVDGGKQNIAYIDAANLDKALKLSLGWQLDYAAFRVWLTEKYGVDRAYLFIGFVPRYTGLYTHLQECGFTVVFKDVIYNGNKPKGNCDAELIMQATEDLYEGVLDKAVIIASDGDYTPLVKKLREKDALAVIFSPARANKCSILLKRTGAPIAYLDDQRGLLEQQARR